MIARLYVRTTFQMLVDGHHHMPKSTPKSTMNTRRRLPITTIERVYQEDQLLELLKRVQAQNSAQVPCRMLVFPVLQ